MPLVDSILPQRSLLHVTPTPTQPSMFPVRPDRLLSIKTEMLNKEDKIQVVTNQNDPDTYLPLKKSFLCLTTA